MHSLLTHAGARTRRALALSTLLLGSLGAAACDDDDDPTGTNGERGTYALLEVDDESVPVTFTVTVLPNPPVDVTFNSGSIVLQSGGRYAATLDIDVDGTPSGFTDAGDYVISGNDITFTSDDGGTFSGELNGNDLELPDVGFDIDGDDADDVSFKFELRKQ